MDKLALITGGTSGIGKEFANQLAQQGYNIIIVGRDNIRGLEICKQLEKNYGIKCQLMIADLSKESGLKIVEEKINSLNSLDFLVNAAGFGFKENFLDGNIDKWQDMIFVHNTVTMRLSYLAGHIMKQNNKGNIINISSLASFLSVGDPLYASTKAFVRYFSTNIHYDWKKYGVYVQALCPGFVETNFFVNAGVDKTPQLGLLTTNQVVKVSLKYVNKKKAICVPGFISKCLKILIQILPNSLIYKILSKSFN
ncbi:MAG: SDR family NAD(P)-dependent oxidoreductase [Candidatus Absconditicoccaceae bacterium]